MVLSVERKPRGTTHLELCVRQPSLRASATRLVRLAAILVCLPVDEMTFQAELVVDVGGYRGANFCSVFIRRQRGVACSLRRNGKRKFPIRLFA